MRVVLVGPPGAGKGTQAQILASKLSIPKVSTGDIFRANVSGGTELGKKAQAYMDRGDLVPDEITNAMVRDRLAEDDARAGFLLDGFPRNLAQAETLDEMLADLGVKLDVVLELVVDEEEVIRRLAERARIDNRSDDNEETIRHRLVVYGQTAPLVSFTRARTAGRSTRQADRGGHPAAMTARKAGLMLRKGETDQLKSPAEIEKMRAAASRGALSTCCARRCVRDQHLGVGRPCRAEHPRGRAIRPSGLSRFPRRSALRQ